MSIFGAVATGVGETIAAGTVIADLSTINRMVKCRSCGKTVRRGQLGEHLKTHGSRSRKSRTKHHPRRSTRSQGLPRGWDF